MFATKRFLTVAASVATVALLASSCATEGCTDPNATNFDSDADKSDGSCTYATRNFVPTDFTIDGENYKVVAGNITGDFTMCNNFKWLIDGGVFVESGATLTICEGTEIFAKPDGDTDFLTISQGAKIEANGTASAPIVFSAFDATPGSWGGLIVNGFGEINTGATAESECGAGTYGGTDNADNSGTLRYVRIEYAGLICATDDELNGFTFNAVGSGTTVEYIQAYRGADDGIEFFGGAVSVKWAVSSGNYDDSFDWTHGWVGNGQFWVVHQNSDNGDRGFEADNNGDNNSVTPFSNPTIANVTIVNVDDGDGENTGMRLREGTKGTIVNAIVANSPANGVRVSDDQTTDNMNDGSLSLNGAIVFNAGTPWKDCAPFENDPTNSIEDPGLNGYVGTVTNGNEQDPTSLGAWFSEGSFIGAVPSSNDWTAGWTRSL